MLSKPITFTGYMPTSSASSAHEAHHQRSQPMRHAIKAIVVALFFSFVVVGNVYSDSGVERVGDALNQMHQWLGDNENARQWKQFLRSDELVAQLAKGKTADRRTVSEILARYSSNTAGLDKNHIRVVREAIEAWLSELPSSIGDLKDSV